VKIGAVVLSIIAFISVIVIGQWHWKNEIRAHENQAQALEYTDAMEASNDEKEAVSSEKTQDSTDLEKLTAKLPDEVKKKIKAAYNDHEQVNVLLSGGHEISGLASLLEEKLNHTYGENLFKVTELNFDRKTSMEVYNNDLDAPIADQTPDLVIFTSLLINDAGKVSTNDSSQVPLLIKDRILKKSPETVFMIEPQNPVTSNPYINDRLEEVEAKAKTAGIPYIDHFSEWPEEDDLKAYLDEKGQYPNEKGLSLWAGLLANYFTSKK